MGLEDGEWVGGVGGVDGTVGDKRGERERERQGGGRGVPGRRFADLEPLHPGNLIYIYIYIYIYISLVYVYYTLVYIAG